MAAKPRKRPARPAEGADAAPNPPELAPAPAQVPAQAPAPPAAPIAQVVEPVIPRNPDDVIHNVIVRQLADDVNNPPPQEAESPALRMLSEIALARQEGRSLEPYKQQIGVQIAGGDELNRLTWHLYRRYRVNKLVMWLQADEVMDRVLMRCFRRGDFTPTEALVFKKLSHSTVGELAEELLNELKENMGQVDPEELITKLSVTSQVTENEAQSHALLERTTPQGREIVRKLVFEARQKVFKKK